MSGVAADPDVALAGTAWPEGWDKNARCRTAPTGLFFPERGDHLTIGAAKRICAQCPVTGACLAYALTLPGLHGIWGGTTPDQRTRIRNTPPQPPASPPPANTARLPGTIAALLEDLTDHPGRWARVATYTSKHSAAAVASMYRTGRRTPPPGHWTFEGRLHEGGSALYARFDGPPQTERNIA